MRKASRPPCEASSQQIPETDRSGPTRGGFGHSALTCLDRDRSAWLLAVAGRRLLPALARAARSLAAREGWVPFGYARLSDFARERLGRCGRWASDLAVLGEGLARLPALEPAMTGADGSWPVGRVAALAIARTASLESLAAWVARARSSTVRELLDATRTARRGGPEHPLPRPGGDARVSACAVPDARSHPTAAVQVASSPSTGAIQEGALHPTGAVQEEDDGESPCEARLVLPMPVDVAFDETFDLYRAVTGGEATRASFVEALVGEAAAGPHPPDATVIATRPVVPEARREAALARATDRWMRLRAAHGSSSPADEADEAAALGASVDGVLLRVSELEQRAGEGDPEALALQLEALVRLEDEIERLLGRVLHEMGRHGDWIQLGFAGVGHYSVERLGIPRRTGEYRAGIVNALRRLPLARAAYENGALGHEAAWLVARVLGPGPAGPDLEAAWVERAREVTIKRLRDEVRRARLAGLGQLQTGAGESAGGAPGADIDALPTSALLPGNRGRAARCRCLPVPPATDAEWHASLRRWPGRTRLRVWRLGRLALAAPSADVFLGMRLPEELASAFLAAIESERRRLGQLADAVPWSDPWPDPAAPPSVLAAREFVVRLRRVPAWVGLLAMLEDFAITWDDPRSMEEREWEATYESAGYRCMAPGCTARKRIHDHHVVYRSRDGSDEPWNQLAACAMHHLQGEHGELAQVRGKAPLGLTWRLGKPEFGSWWRNERRLDRS